MKQPTWIAASILSANFAKLGQEVEDVLEAGADAIHFDVMDNHYVPNLTVGPIVCQALKDHGIQAPIDVHLMVEPVDSLIEPFAQAGASYISFHPEATRHVDRTVSLIQSFGVKAGLALNPATPLSYLHYLMDKIDMILLMTVNPGFGGQPFIPEMLEKIREARFLINKHGRPIRLEVDGGINPKNVKGIAQKGADTFVAGSAIFKSNNYAETISAMRQKIG